ncbi:MAG: hypothetical protein WCI36_00615 [bacterium]
MSIKYININCRETASLDLRQARAVLKYKPDIIFLEYPNDSQGDTFSMRKPVANFAQKTLKINPWLMSDISMWENIKSLWKENIKTTIYAVDGPTDLVSEMLYEWQYMYPCAKRNWFWWVRIYLREKYMAKHISQVISKLDKKTDYTVLVFLQKFHWVHVQFLLTEPTEEETWKYYFGKFKDIDPVFINSKIKERNKVFYKYWKKFKYSE